MKIKEVYCENTRLIRKKYIFTMDEVMSGGMQNLINQLDSCKKESHTKGSGKVEWQKWYNFERDEFVVKVQYELDEA